MGRPLFTYVLCVRSMPGLGQLIVHLYNQAYLVINPLKNPFSAHTSTFDFQE